jgi:toxin ParE1/3/4
VKVVYHRLVQADLDQAWHYYEEASTGLGDQFFTEFLEMIAAIQRHPQRWGFASRGRRLAQFKRFPYKMLYRVEAERIKVLVVKHQKRRPSYGDGRH